MAHTSQKRHQPPQSQSKPASDPNPIADSNVALAGLQQILASEERLRSAGTEIELFQLIVNETRRLTGARQVFLLRRAVDRKHRVIAVSSLALINRDTPLIRWVEKMASRLAAESDSARPTEFRLPAYTDADLPETTSYPFPEFAWQPLVTTDGTVFAGLLQSREDTWRPDALKLLTRQAAVYATTWRALHGSRTLRPPATRRKWIGLTLAVLCCAAAFIPMPMTTLAPVEIVAAEPEIVTAPIDGVIKQIFVDSNRPVAAGTPLFSYDDTVLNNRFELADREMRVSLARYQRAEQAALSDSKARHNLMIAKSEYQLKKAERDYAGRLRAKTVVTATRAGVLIYTAKEDWLGRPVKTGEKIMSVARPDQVVARIELPIADAISIASGADVRLFLDAAPLNARTARITSESYHAEANASNQLVYTLYANLQAQPVPATTPTLQRTDRKSPPRIGARGTAQVFGATVPLAFFLFRRPIAFARQTFGI